MNVLHVVNLFPTSERPDYGIFVKEQIESIAAIDGVNSQLIIIDVENRGLWEYRRSIPKIRNKLKDCDIVHAHHIFSALVVIMAGGRRKLVVSFLSDRFDITGRIEWLGPVLYYFVLILCRVAIRKCSPGKGLFRRKLRYIPNGVDFRKFTLVGRDRSRATLGLDRSAFLPLFISSYSVDRPVKRKDLFDRIVSRYSAVRSPATNVVPIALCNIERDEIQLYYNAANVYVLVSDREGSPNAVKEALSCGCPVAARDVGDVRQLLSGVPHTYLITSEAECDSIDLVEFIKRTEILTDEDRKKIRIAFQKKDLGIEAVASRVIEVYLELCPYRS